MLLEFEEKILSDEIVLLEDKPITQQNIKNILEKEYNWKVKVFNTKEDVISYAEKQHAFFFILDIHMGVHREQEGLDALEEIKKINKNAFTCIFSARKDCKKLAERLRADFFLEKSQNTEQDIQTLASEILKFQIKCLDMIKQAKLSKMKDLDISDTNISAYKKLIRIPEWVDRVAGNYVAFVDGDYIDKDVKREKLISRIREKYFDRPRFIKKVVKEGKNSVDIPFYEIK